MPEEKQKVALHITEEAKNNTFENCDIQGAKIEGKGTKMIKTRIFNKFPQEHPKTFKGIIIMLVVGFILLVAEYTIFQ